MHLFLIWAGYLPPWHDNVHHFGNIIVIYNVKRTHIGQQI